MTEDTTQPSYWLNWRFFLCALFILKVVAFSGFLIWKYESRRKNRAAARNTRLDDQILLHPNEAAAAAVVYEDEPWKTCLKTIHPLWLLCFRVLAFAVTLFMIVGNTVADGIGIFIYYTQWTFTLVTIYFGFATAFSIYGCWKYQTRKSDSEDGFSGKMDAERGGTDVAPWLGEHQGPTPHRDHPVAGYWGYFFQIYYQICAGAVVLTDVVFWVLIFPFLSHSDAKLSFYVVGMHTVNFIVLGDTLLNCMRFPLFRIAYFILWTSVYVVVQWIAHACVSFKWPYDFFKLSSSHAPLWYLGVGLLHIPCFGFFALVVWLKHLWMSKCFPGSYQGMRW